MLKNERKDLVLRPFENLFIEASAVPKLVQHPHQDSSVQQAYRRHMVTIPDVVVNQLQEEIVEANKGSKNYDWWKYGIDITRTLKSQQEIEKQLKEFVRLASSNQQVSDLLQRDFNIEKLNSELQSYYTRCKATLEFTFRQKANTDVSLTIIGFEGEKRVEETIIWKKGTGKTTTKKEYNAITSIRVQGKNIQGNIFKVAVQKFPLHYLIVTNYKQLRAIKPNSIRVALTYDIAELNRILETVQTSAVLEIFSSSAKDIEGELIIKGRAIITKGKVTVKKGNYSQTLRLKGIEKVSTFPLRDVTDMVTDRVKYTSVTSIQYKGEALRGLLRIKVEGVPVFDINFL